MLLIAELACLAAKPPTAFSTSHGTFPEEMTGPLTTETALELTERWHDQTLDLESLKSNKADRQCTFTVLEKKPDASAERQPLLKRHPLQRCHVTVKNVTGVRLLDAEGEVELYINEVKAAPESLRVECVHGTLDVLGENLEISLDVDRSETGATEVTVSTPLGSFSWRAKEPKTKS